jgi:RNA polymerase sigma-70 factor (ECF subfamily)
MLRFVGHNLGVQNVGNSSDFSALPTPWKRPRRGGGIFRARPRCRGNRRVSGPHDLTERIVGLLPRLRRFALTLTRRWEDADDLVQATVERALTRLGGWREDTRLDSWLFKMMQNLWIDQARARRVRGGDTVGGDAELALLPGVDGRPVMEARLTLRATLEAVMQLPEDQRAVILLVVVEGFSYREAADVLGVPIGTVMSRVSRARAALEDKVAAAGQPPLSVVRR